MTKSPGEDPDPEMRDIDEMGRLERRHAVGKAPIPRVVLICAAIVVIAAVAIWLLSR